MSAAWETIDSLRARLQPHHAVTMLRVDKDGGVLSVRIESCVDRRFTQVGEFRGVTPSAEQARDMCLLRGVPRERAEREVRERFGDRGALRFSEQGCEVGTIEDGAFRVVGFGATWKEALR